MNRSRMFLLAGVALALSVVVTAGVYRVLRNRMQPADDMSQIIVASRDVALGARLTEADLRLAPWPKAAPLKGSFTAFAEVVGRGVITPMIPNEPILDTKLAPSGAGAGLTTAIPEGMRAVGVKVNDVIGVAGFVLPGSRVDVILSGSPDVNRETEMSKVILENIQVLSAGQNVARDGDGKAQNVQVVTLLVTPDDSQKLALASVDGKIQLSLRNPLDLKSVNPPAERLATLYGDSTPVPEPKKAVVRTTPRITKAMPPAAPAPVPVVQPLPTPPPVPAPVAEARKFEMMVIQGTKTEKVSFDQK